MTGMCIYGMVHAVHIYTTRYEVPSKKDAHLKIALVADLHLGYSIGSHQMEEMVEKINAEEPDVVVIAGDIFDNEYDAIYEPDRVADLLAGLKSRYGTYACYGNHDLDEKILAGFTFETKEERIADRRFGEFLDRAKIHLLEDDVVCIDDAFYLAGRKDPDRIRKTQETRDTPSELLTGLDQSLPVFVIDHQPSELTELAEAGADLDLGGHTHDGQLFWQYLYRPDVGECLRDEESRRHVQHRHLRRGPLGTADADWNESGSGDHRLWKIRVDKTGTQNYNTTKLRNRGYQR